MYEGSHLAATQVSASLSAGAFSSVSVALVTLGCRVNRSENEALIRSLAKARIPLADPDQADLIVVNTCCVTGEAEAKTRKALRREAARPNARQVIAYGCAATLFADELEALAPNIVVVPHREAVMDAIRLTASHLEGHEVREEGDPEESKVPNIADHSRPSLKIQDGCDRRCSYCIVWKARGASSSLDSDQVSSLVSDLSSKGFGEVVLCGVNLGTYVSNDLDLAGLLRKLLAETDVGRLRLSSIEPQDVTDDLLELMAASEGRIAPYLAMPLQSGCDATLERMGRLYRSADYRERVEAARTLMPDVAIAADLICGFPGETDEEWAETLAFCEDLALANLHVFRYSPRPGTIAANLPNQVPAPVAKVRSEEARHLRDRLRASYAASLVGTTQRILVETPGWGITGGLVRARVDESHPRSKLVDVRAHSLQAPGILDCRSASCELLSELADYRSGRVKAWTLDEVAERLGLHG